MAPFGLQSIFLIPLRAATLGRFRSMRALLLLCLAPFAASAQILDRPEELLPGFKANQVYSSSGIDNVNAFSGDSGVVVPIGPEYKLAAGVTFQLTAAYSNKFWLWDSNTCGLTPPPASQPIEATFAIGGPLGLGWAWPLGYVEASPGAVTYYSPDGGRHEFMQTTWEARWITTDGSNLRLDPDFPPPGYKIEFPDGTTRVYSTYFLPPQAGTPPDNLSPDFYNRKADAGPLARYLLHQIFHPNGTTVLLEVDAEHQGHPAWITLNPRPGKEPDIRLYWGLFPASPPPSDLQWTVLQSATFQNPSGGLLTVTPAYETKSITRLRTGGGSECPTYSTWAEVPVLASLESTASGISPERTSFEYYDYYPNHTGAIDDGSLKKITLPTGGTIEYGYGPTRETPGGSGAPSEMDPDEWQRLEILLNESPAVTLRRETDPTNPSYVSVTRWQRVHRGGINWRYRRVVMLAPGIEREFFFSVAEGSAPPSGLEFLSRTFQPGSFELDGVWDPTRDAERTFVSCYQSDDGTSQSLEACNLYKDEVQLSMLPTDWNVRKSRSLTWYTDLEAVSSSGWKTGYSDCGSTEPCSKTQSTDYSAPARQYKTVTTSANAKGLMRIKQRETTTNYTRVKDGPWVLGVFDYRRIQDLARDGESNWCVEPCNARTDYGFTTQGYLDFVRIDDPLGSVTRDFTPDEFGNPHIEIDLASESGGSLPSFSSTPFETRRTFQNGMVLKTERKKADGTNWYEPTFDVTRDVNGYVTSSRDPNGLQTSYTYDALGRLRSVSPPSSNPSASKTTYCYEPPILGPTQYRGAYVIMREGGLPENECSAVDSGGVGRFEVYLYDGFGRLAREIQKIPTQTGTALSFRKTTYDNAGRRSFLSEWDWCPSSDATACFATGNTTGTTWQTFDLFGRPMSIQKADGTTVTISYADTYCPNGADSCAEPKSVAFTDTTVTTTTSNVAGGSSSVRQRKDLLGRIVEETYPYLDATGPDGGMLYRYNVLDKVAYASTLADEAGPRVQNARTFGYDLVGNLRSEWHPEKGTTTYLQYDALGANTWRREDKDFGTYFNSTFDRLGRLETLTAGPTIDPSSHGTYLTQTWDSGPYGGTYPKGKLTTRVGSNYGTPPGTLTGTVTENLGYSGPAGQLTFRRTELSNPLAAFEEGWTYDSLGYLTAYQHPLPLDSSLIRPTELYGYQAGRVVSVGVGMGGRSRALVENASYNPAGGLASYSISNSSVTTITPDAMGRPHEISTSRLGEPLFGTGVYSYDGLGNITAMGNDHFVYDVRSRLVSASFGGGAQTETYQEYDQYGNLGKRTRNGGTPWDPAIDQTHNRLASPYAYDAVGNLVGEGESITYTYDALSRQTSYDDDSTPSGRHERYLYDGAGERLETIEGSVARLSLRGSDARVATEIALPATGGSETSRTDYFHLGNLQIAVFSQAGISIWTYYASDHLGTPRLQMGGIGQKGGPYPRQLFHYWPHGELRSGGSPGRFGLAGMEQDLASGNHYDHARYYRGPTGRFNAPDLLSGSAGDAESWNRYTYARNNPLKYVDPDGNAPLDAKDVPGIVADTAIGALDDVGLAVATPVLLLEAGILNNNMRQVAAGGALLAASAAIEGASLIRAAGSSVGFSLGLLAPDDTAAAAAGFARNAAGDFVTPAGQPMTEHAVERALNPGMSSRAPMTGAEVDNVLANGAARANQGNLNAGSVGFRLDAPGKPTVNVSWTTGKVTTVVKNVVKGAAKDCVQNPAACDAVKP